MCRDISLHADIQIVTRDFRGVKISPEVTQHSDQMVHVTCEVLPHYPILTNRGELLLENMSWGIIPAYEKDPKQRQLRRRNMVNAQSERILGDHKSYWYKLRNKRCLIPVTGIYEHRKVAGFKNKIPYLVNEKGRDGFYVPALYQISEEVDQETGEIYKESSFTMITRAANELMMWIHNDGDNKHRMPLFLTPELEKAWLQADLSENDMTEIFQFRMPSDGLDHHPVFTIRSNKPQPDGKPKDALYEWEGKLPVFNQESASSGSDKQTSLF
ncbi:SOS response-associated peptidase family protein [Mucilaginibacter sp. CSA2-8R]|uniref:SOS response-associated peptidase n=1 Tax=Mucilaginibacter sp. CSA2-8R TaxID=3141542 RepID=UPI00315CA6ED